ncbi:MAG: LysM peptidoglycan-binding domain-containing protein [Phycisphaerales bacterium]|nr:LysM peptidoglycan-binding domain-containing protein [Phycisphaerales bacterium]
MRKEIKVATGIGFSSLVALAVIGWHINRGASSPATDEAGKTEITRSPFHEDRADIWTDPLHEPTEHDDAASPPPPIPTLDSSWGDRPPTHITREDDRPRQALPSSEDSTVEPVLPEPAEEIALVDEQESQESPVAEPTIFPEPETGLRAPKVAPPTETSERFARTPAPTPPSGLVVTTQPASRMREYVVKPNDTLSAISVQYYGHARYADEIIKANPGIKPRQLRVGMKINIPELSVEAAPAVQPPTAAAAPARKIAEPLKDIPPERAYRVQPGEGWYELAARFLGNGNDWPELFEENRGRVPHNPRDLRAGTLIQLPERAVKDKTD